MLEGQTITVRIIFLLLQILTLTISAVLETQHIFPVAVLGTEHSKEIQK